MWPDRMEEERALLQACGLRLLLFGGPNTRRYAEDPPPFAAARCSQAGPRRRAGSPVRRLSLLPQAPARGRGGAMGARAPSRSPRPSSRARWTSRPRSCWWLTRRRSCAPRPPSTSGRPPCRRPRRASWSACSRCARWRSGSGACAEPARRRGQGLRSVGAPSRKGAGASAAVLAMPLQRVKRPLRPRPRRAPSLRGDVASQSCPGPGWVAAAGPAVLLAKAPSAQAAAPGRQIFF